MKTKGVDALELLNELQDALGIDAPLTYAKAFVLLAREGGEADQGSLQKRLGVSPSTMVRAVQAMGPASWVKDEKGRRKGGLGLIRSEQDAQNYRLRRLTLTPEGRALADRLGL